MPSRAGSVYRPMRNFSCDSDARRCAPVEETAFPGRLRRWTAHSRTPQADASSGNTFSHEAAALPANPQEPFITSTPDTGRPDILAPIRHRAVDFESSSSSSRSARYVSPNEPAPIDGVGRAAHAAHAPPRPTERGGRVGHRLREIRAGGTWSMAASVNGLDHNSYRTWLRSGETLWQ